MPNRRLQEVKGKTLLHWHVKVIHISANKLFRSSSQNKFSKSSHGVFKYLKFLNINPWKVSKSAQLKIHQARIVKRGIFRVVHMISELNSKGNVFGLYSV